MATIEFPHGKIHDVVDNPHFLLTNKNGDYLSLGNPNSSNYNGYYIKRKTNYYKVLANVIPQGSTETLRTGTFITRNSGPGHHQNFFLYPEGVYADISGEGNLTLDCKRLYDESTEGRIYKVQMREAHDSYSADGSLSKITVINVVYSKEEGEKYDIHVTVATTLKPTITGVWKQNSYSYDNRRGTHNSNWVYELFKFKGTGEIAVSADISPNHVQSNALKLLMKKLPGQKLAELPFEMQVAMDSLRTLTTDEGIMAGLPWFFHHWSRDELIACGGYLTRCELQPVVNILDKWYDAVRPDGTMPAIFPDKGLDSTDAPGWLGKRTCDFIMCARKKSQEKYLTKTRLEKWCDTTGIMIDAISGKLTDNLVWTGKNTTWMDTDWNDDGRQGACIEIQALTIALCESHELLCKLTGKKIKPERQNLSRKILYGVHQRLCQGDLLLDRVRQDGNPDFTFRPNIFIAWYVAPRMFTKKEWAKFFHRAIPEIWLPWGGLSSISKESGDYQEVYTGESVQSYHRGDSWYWVNNIAGIAMISVDEQGFNNTVKKIARASVRDMLSKGFIGHCSEISSANEQEPAGCWAQAWSASTLVELLSKGSFL